MKLVLLKLIAGLICFFGAIVLATASSPSYAATLSASVIFVLVSSVIFWRLTRGATGFLYRASYVLLAGSLLLMLYTGWSLSVVLLPG